MSAATEIQGPPTLPRVDQRQLSATQAEYVLFIPDDLDWFDGHFDGMPVVPGVVLVHWAAHFATHSFKGCGFSGEARQLKFRKLLLPGTTLTLSLELDHENAGLEFVFRSVHGEHCSGTLTLRD